MDISKTATEQQQKLILIPCNPENREERLPMHFPGLDLDTNLISQTQSMRGRNRYILRDVRGDAWVVTVEPARLLLQGESA